MADKYRTVLQKCIMGECNFGKFNVCIRNMNINEIYDAIQELVDSKQVCLKELLRINYILSSKYAFDKNKKNEVSIDDFDDNVMSTSLDDNIVIDDMVFKHYVAIENDPFEKKTFYFDVLEELELFMYHYGNDYSYYDVYDVDGNDISIRHNITSEKKKNKVKVR